MSLELTPDRTFVIAEAGTCHASNDPEFRFRRAMKYVHAAVRAGADAIKFQMFENPNPEDMFCWMEGDELRATRWRQSYMSLDEWAAIKGEAESCGIVFLASAFEYNTAVYLQRLDVQATKVASRAAPYLREFDIAKSPKPFLISNGMEVVEPGEDRVVIECEANYPSTALWAGEFPGFSDHSGDPWRAIDAISRGCQLLEVHFYLDQLHAGPDLRASLNIEDLTLICRARDAFASFN
jgi:N,N'-diacetyllegionaminate synthase